MAALFLSITTALTLLVNASPHPQAPSSAAVYLKPYSAVPTGHYNIEKLKSRLIRQEKITWVLVKDQKGLIGWTPRQNLLTPLHFSQKAQLMAKSPMYRFFEDPQPEAQWVVTKEETVSLLQIQNQWAQIEWQNKTVWTPLTSLFPLEKDPGVFIAKKSFPLRQKPQMKSEHLISIPESSRLIPRQINGNWVQVQYENRVGYVPLDDVLMRVDIASRVKTQQGFVPSSRQRLSEKIYSIFINPLWLGSSHKTIPLFEMPSAAASLVGHIEPWKNLIQQDSIDQDWALSQVSSLGEVWWQIPQDRTIFRKLIRLPLAQIHDVKESPLFQHVKIATAKGLYRSTDGVLWTSLKGFEGTNPAFTFAKDGVLFVEDKVSYDHGENFSAYIHWENLLKTLKTQNIGVRNQIRIQGIETLNNNSKEIILHLDMGLSRPLSLYSANRGYDWHLVNRR